MRGEKKAIGEPPVEYYGQLGTRIGSGAYGFVYELKGIDGNPLQINQKECVVKTPLSITEEKITSQYRQTFSKNNQYLITERIPGRTLASVGFEFLFNSTFSSMEGFFFRLQIKRMIAAILNRYHHRTPRSHAIIHNDVNASNILIDFDIDTLQIKEVNIIDFSCSLDIVDDNPDILHADWTPIGKRTPFTARENRFRFPFVPAYAGTKSDIYQAGNLFSVELDYVCPKIKKFNTEISPEIGDFDINKYVKKFQDLMLEYDDYQKRPNSDEMLLFFNTLYRIYIIAKAKKGSDNIDIITVLIAKLVLLGNGVWNKNLVVEEKSDKGEPKNWGDFDFENENNIFTSHAVLRIAKYKDLGGNIENIMAYEIDLSRKIVAETKIINIIKHLVDRFELDFLPRMTGNLEQRRKVAKIAISQLLDQAKDNSEIEKIVVKLESLARENKIDFLYKRQGNYFTFSYHNHKWNGKKVSGTWIEIMDIVQKRKNQLSTGMKIELFKKP